MSLLNKIPLIYRQASPGKLYGVLLAIISLLAGLLLVGSSAWFITATSLTGMGLISLQSYNLFLPGAAIQLLAVLEGLQVQWLLDPDLDIIEALRRFRDLMTGPLEDPPA